jgi:hypothetical protein
MVSCTGDTCSVTLAGRGARAEVFGTTFAFESIRDGRATVRVNGLSVSCTDQQSVAAGPLRLRCTTVTHAAVTLVVSRH